METAAHGYSLITLSQTLLPIFEYSLVRLVICAYEGSFVTFSDYPPFGYEVMHIMHQGAVGDAGSGFPLDFFLSSWSWLSA